MARGWAGAVAAVGIAIAVSGCSASPAAPAASGTAGTSPFGHVHGIGVDPASGDAFAATHAGVFALPPLDTPDAVSASAVAGPVAGRAQDTMGFTMVGEVMFGSGHPDPAEKPALDPPNLGLITSRDGASTWTSVSLRGETDFHDLAVARDGDAFRIYGYDSGSGVVKVSSDSGTTWTSGAQLAARDLSVDPAAPGTVYATTAQGLVMSTDGALTFQPAPDAPALYLLDALGDGKGGLIGVDVDGTVWVREGGTWSSTGTVTGTVEALTYSAAPSPRLVVATGDGIMSSSDRGATWRDVVVT